VATMVNHAREITPEVYQVDGRNFTASDDAATYLVVVKVLRYWLITGPSDHYPFHIWQ